MISVIIPIYNSSKYLRSCLDSILSQNFSSYEIICVDDGSTDSSADILAEYEQKSCKVFVISQENKGRACARNTGLRRARGEYICFVDSDDELKPNALRTLHAYIEKGVDAVVSSIEVSYTTHEEKRAQDSSYYRIERDCTFQVSPHMLTTFHSSVCASLFRKEIILDNKIFFPESLNFEDFFFHWTYFLYCHKITFLKEPTYKYIRREGSIMSQTFNGSSAALDHLLIVEKIIQFYVSRDFYQNNEKILLHLLSKYFWFSFRYVPLKDRCTVISECLRIIEEHNLPVQQFEDLNAIKNGQIDNFFQISADENTLLAVELNKVLNKIFPIDSKRRKMFFSLARKAYRLSKK